MMSYRGKRIYAYMFLSADHSQWSNRTSSNKYINKWYVVMLVLNCISSYPE